MYLDGLLLLSTDYMLPFDHLRVGTCHFLEWLNKMLDGGGTSMSTSQFVPLRLRDWVDAKSSGASHAEIIIQGVIEHWRDGLKKGRSRGHRGKYLPL
jgi:hypothetical protein